MEDRMIQNKIFPKEDRAEGETDTVRIQEAIDSCHKQGGGRVVLAAGSYVTGTLCLKSHVTLCLEKGALLLGSSHIEDYPDNETCFNDAVGHKRGKALLYAYDADEIGLEGEGVVDGRGGEYPPEHPAHLVRPFLVRLVNCRNIRVRNVTLRQSAAWCLHVQDSRNVEIMGVTIYNRCNGNNDGIDIDGCSNVDVESCRIDAGDDALCLKSTSEQPCRSIRICNCQVTTNWAGFKIGTESVGDFQDIMVENCFFYDVKGCGIKIVPVDGGNVRNVTLKNIKMFNCTGPVFISTGERLRQYFAVKRQKPGTIEHLVLENITADAVTAAGGFYQGAPWGNAKGCVVVSGLQDAPVRNVIFRSCSFAMPGGIAEMPQGPVPEMGVQYPEFHLFDILPAWGMYLRHGDGIVLEQVTMTEKKEDVRPMLVKEDCSNVSEG